MSPTSNPSLAIITTVSRLKRRSPKRSHELLETRANAGATAPGVRQAIESASLASGGPAHVGGDALEGGRKREHLDAQCHAGNGHRDLQGGRAQRRSSSDCRQRARRIAAASCGRRSHRGASASPPVCRLARSVRRRSKRRPRLAGRQRRESPTCSRRTSDAGRVAPLGLDAHEVGRLSTAAPRSGCSSRARTAPLNRPSSDRPSAAARWAPQPLEPPHDLLRRRSAPKRGPSLSCSGSAWAVDGRAPRSPASIRRDGRRTHQVAG